MISLLGNAQAATHLAGCAFAGQVQTASLRWVAVADRCSCCNRLFDVPYHSRRARRTADPAMKPIERQLA